MSSVSAAIDVRDRRASVDPENVMQAFGVQE